MIKTQFEEDFVICYFDDSIPVLSHRWKRFIDAEHMQAALLRMIALYSELKIEYPNISWLGDTRTMGVLSLEYQKWLEDTWPGIMESAGIKKHALIIPENLFAKLAMDKFVKNIKASHHNIIIQYFKDEESANEWLKNDVI